MISHRILSFPSAPSCLLGGFVLLAAGCGGSASVNAEAHSAEGGEVDVNFDAEGDAAWDQVAATQQSSTSKTQASGGARAGELALLGARHDLLLAEGMDSKCSCLVVVLGAPSTPGLVWTDEAPSINSQTQLIVALGSDGVACDEPGGGASYMGYVKKGKDVIVSVEAAVSGRPVTYGAIIPRPDSGGQVFIQPYGKIPYGRGLSGEKRCKLTASQ